MIRFWKYNLQCIWNVQRCAFEAFSSCWNIEIHFDNDKKNLNWKIYDKKKSIYNRHVVEVPGWEDNPHLPGGVGVDVVGGGAAGGVVLPVAPGGRGVF